ncbi:insulin-like peptide receptor isoform X2 [Mercenaria mercenaria]|uniref:insulin-like peptide receptor isoform X2 n=1 Tax=Mercenaria mercenaria TaxID=6596 RepID=UPI00234F1D95|nr:insulin-like peptide receptor isoform X2 [Mercenaria mercenaria]
MLNSNAQLDITLMFVIAGIILTTGSLAVQGKVCGSKDIRNRIDEFVELENCSTIEGNLSIVFIDEGISGWEDYQGGFPDLVEITGVLLLFRVEGLKSIGQLFPNLAIIGGERLFEGYALVVYEMFDLEDIGLSGLILIRNGAVRIEKNPQLCYLDTVDWGRITTGVSPSENFFKGNNECADTCPSDCDTTGGVRRCWNALSCQKMLACPSGCPTGVCNGDICCHPNCVGGCSGPSADQCTACKDVIHTSDDGEETCVQQCPTGFYMYRSRRCLTASECLNFSDYKLDREKCDAQIPDRPCLKLVTMYDGEEKIPVCYEGCPGGYKTDPDNSTRCIQCEGGQCPKVCNGKIIDSLHAAENLKDCRIIHGSLVIKLKECVDEDKLESYLGQIVEVTGHIAVSYSYALHSLRFFNGLRKVGGENPINYKYSIHIFNNPNLQELIPELSHNFLEVSKGTVLFKNNEKLSYEKITDFVSMTNLNIEDTEVSKATNGNRLSSAVLQLNLQVLKTSPHVAFITWPRMPTLNILQYSVFWKKTSEESVTVFDEVDACTILGWRSKDIECLYEPQTCSKDAIIQYIGGLKPWTRYAAYIRAQTPTTESAVSNVVYFLTDPDAPTAPLNLEVRATEPGTLRLTWDPPSIPNGNVTSYRIKWNHMNYNVEKYRQRDYCSLPLSGIDDKSTDVPLAECCPCPTKTQQHIINEMLAERKANLDMVFQDMLQNRVYIKRMYRNKDRRSAENSDIDSGENPINFAHVYNTEEFIVTNLGNYQKYSFEVQACHTKYQDRDTMCSGNAIEWGTTLPNKQSDLVDESTVRTEEVKNGIRLEWTEPAHPNGIILNYDIENMRNDPHNPYGNMPVLICLLNNGTGRSNFTLYKLTPGKYQFRIRATSLAGTGPWTQYLYYTVSQRSTAGSITVNEDVFVKATPDSTKVVVSLNCTGSVAGLSYYIINRINWDFVDKNGTSHGVTKAFYHDSESDFAERIFSTGHAKLQYTRLKGYFYSFQLKFYGITQEDAGIYRCTHLDRYGNTIDSKNVSLTVVSYECYHWTDEDLWVMGRFRTPMKEKARCEEDLGYVFTQGKNEDFAGCKTCWCCKPVST